MKPALIDTRHTDTRHTEAVVKVFKVFKNINLEPKNCKNNGKWFRPNKCKDGEVIWKAWKDPIRRLIFQNKSIVDEIVDEIVNYDVNTLKNTLMTLDEKNNQNKAIPDNVWEKLQEMYDKGKEIEEKKEKEKDKDKDKDKSLL
jgi:hypothetical protein